MSPTSPSTGPTDSTTKSAFCGGFTIIIGPAVFLLIAGFPLAAVGALAVVQAVLGLAAHANVR